ncbi:MAG: hypothetical protein ACT4PT_11080 [Methanobacteriota archaeon]
MANPANFKKMEWERVLLFVDIAAVGIFVLLLTVLLQDVYELGWFYTRGVGGLVEKTWMAILRDCLVGGVTLGWIFYRWLGVRSAERANPWW